MIDAKCNTWDGGENNVVGNTASGGKSVPRGKNATPMPEVRIVLRVTKSIALGETMGVTDILSSSYQSYVMPVFVTQIPLSMHLMV